VRCELEVGVESVQFHAVGAEEVSSGCVGAVVEREAERSIDQRRGVNRWVVVVVVIAVVAVVRLQLVHR